MQKLALGLRDYGKELERISGLLRNLLAVELWRGGLSQNEIGKRLQVATGTVNKMLKGVTREVGTITKNPK